MGIASSTEKKPTLNQLNQDVHTSPRGSEPTHGIAVPSRHDQDGRIIIGSPTTSQSPGGLAMEIGSYSEGNYLKEEKDVTTVFYWKHGGRNVFLTGNFNHWTERIPMQQSHGDFTTIQTLTPGLYYYRYIVDGKWQTDPEQPVMTDPETGEPCNVLELKPSKNETSILNTNVSSSPPGTYSQDDSAYHEYIKNASTSNPGRATDQISQSPPGLPPYLLKALLNTEPPLDKDPTLLPLPHHVMLNHLYSLPRDQDEVVILGVTQRYRSKFITTVLYKPLEGGATSNKQL
mmetsp:Transcript_1444/g.1912  ORF Transcript_1444/g.1912 Transcript_1444/m.1912 type:complete len:288 (-) Transcript_1444:80-943(-)